MKDQLNKLKIVISFFKIALLAGFCYAVVNSIMNLLSKETGITNSVDKTEISEKIPMPAFTILPFDLTSYKYFHFPSKLQTVMEDGKKFPSWFKPHGEFAKFANETYLKQKYNLSWYDVWSINAKCFAKSEYSPFSSFAQMVTFNPPRGGYFEEVSIYLCSMTLGAITFTLKCLHPNTHLIKIIY